jgi:hypothetical protein
MFRHDGNHHTDLRKRARKKSVTAIGMRTAAGSFGIKTAAGSAGTEAERAIDACARWERSFKLAIIGKKCFDRSTGFQ